MIFRHSVVSNSLESMTIQSMEFCRPEYWSGQPFPFQGIFLTQGSNPDLPHCRWILYQLSHKGSPMKWQTIDKCFIVNIQNTKVMAPGLITSWQIDGETMETGTRLYFLGLQNHCRWHLQPCNSKALAPWKKSYDQTQTAY